MNEHTKIQIRAKATSYIKRVEELKNLLKNGPVKKKAVADDVSDRGNGRYDRDEDESDDPDRRRMMQKFQGLFYKKHFHSIDYFFY